MVESRSRTPLREASPAVSDRNGATVPRAVAVIMDGNGRWARRKGLPRLFGHRAGARTVDRITEVCAARGVEHLALYAFSTENWRRSQEEVFGLWRLLLLEIRRREKKLLGNGIKLRSMGRRDRMPANVEAELRRVEASTGGGERMTLWLALDYGGMWDIGQLVEEVRRRQRAGELGEEPLTSEQLAALLPSGGLPPVDLLIRTAGERRLSNFLPWQLAYSELHFTDVLWPDFGEADLDRAFADFAARDRRYGAAP